MTPKSVEFGKVGRGRPRIFDRQVALDAAMRLFWDRGYQGTSFDDLISTMGISASSFYNAFESKESVFREAIAMYLEASGPWFQDILSEHIDVKVAFRKLLEAIANQFAREDCPAGCMISLAGTHLPPSLNPVKDLMIEIRAMSEAAFVERLRKGRADGEIPADIDIETLAAFYDALSRGLAVQARDGASKKKLLGIVEVAMSAFPKVL